MLEDWLSLRENKNISVVPVLAIYKIGNEDMDAGSGKMEWIENDNIINEEISLIKSYNLSGYALFRYDFLTKIVK